ncbi:winged helix DNA-binding domain-containing protein [Streptomyces sp. NPDC005811]|uniref:winged helix DNA-binding domain-containing protein n=1 Tax=Streptomyces sp. NPDC005811 TaxID=3154565 RepID=UPI0033E7AE16
MPPLTPGELNRATLARQLLLRREALAVPDAVHRVVALQAQHPASPYLALWNRVAGFRPDDLDEAFAAGTVVKATLMRITLHAVHAVDHRAFRGAMQQTLYASRLGARFAVSGLTPADAERIVPDLLEFTRRQRTTAEIRTWLAENLGPEHQDAAWWGLKAYAPLLHAPAGRPWSFGVRASFVAAPPGPPLTGRTPEPDALRALILRYLAAFGPATVADIAQFAMVQRAPIRDAVRGLDDGRLVLLTDAGGGTLYDVPGAPRPPADTPAPPRLLGMWDSILLAYADRSRVIPPEYRRLVTRVNGDVLPTLLVDGRAAGVWRSTAAGVEASAFHPLPAEVWEALSAEARSLTALLSGRGDPDVYSRHTHWWAKLPPAAETRLLGGDGHG